MSTADEQQWLDVRARLNQSRAELGVEAAELYAGLQHVESTALLCRPEWIPAAPIPLESIRLTWDAQPRPPAVSAADVGTTTAGFPTYAKAMTALAAPAVFEDRPSYRLLDAVLDGNPYLRMSAASYFDGVNIGEAVAHELAAGLTGPAGAVGAAGAARAARAARLALRSRIGDPCDLSRRTALPAITTLTVRRDTATGATAFVLHWRDPAKVVHAGGLYQVMPVGVFQPVLHKGGRPDLDLWHCMAREFSEEFLGTDEDYGPGFSYDTWPFFQQLQSAREAGRLRVHCLGLGVDPLTLAVDLLTVAVFDDETFDELFQGLVDINAEGEVTMAPFAGQPVQPMQPAGSAAIQLAWRFREQLGLL